MNDPKIRALFLNTARRNYMKKSDESAGRVEPELAFPDWSGMDDSWKRVSPDAAFELCEQYAAWFSDAAPKWQTQRPEKCLVEFTL